MRFNKFDAAMTVPSAPAETSMYAWRRQQQLSNTAWQHWQQARKEQRAAWQHWKQAREDLGEYIPCYFDCTFDYTTKDLGSVTNTKTLTDDDYYINFDGEQK